jgi:hypothetical protein
LFVFLNISSLDIDESTGIGTQNFPARPKVSIEVCLRWGLSCYDTESLIVDHRGKRVSTLHVKDIVCRLKKALQLSITTASEV